MGSTHLHDPDARLDYYTDWSAWLAAGESIADVTWSVGGYTGTAPDIATEIPSTTRPGVWVEGATLGDTLRLVCHIVTSFGREDDRTHTLFVRQR